MRFFQILSRKYVQEKWIVTVLHKDEDGVMKPHEYVGKTIQEALELCERMNQQIEAAA